MREQESGLNDNCVCSVIVFAAYVANERKNPTVVGGGGGAGGRAIYIICIKEVCPCNSRSGKSFRSADGRGIVVVDQRAYNIIQPASSTTF